MPAELKPLGRACGAEVVGLDVTRPLEARSTSLIEAGLDRYKVLLFRRQPMTAEQLVALSANFGELQAHVQ